MDRIPEISAAELRTALASVEGKRPAMRLVAGIAYKNGRSQTELAAWFGVERKTVYNWLERLDADDLADSVTDESRSGRHRKLAEAHLATLREAVRQPPQAAGFDATSWTPALVQTYLRDAFDVEYSLPSCRRLLREAGLEYIPRGPPAGDEGQDGETDSHGASGVWAPAPRRS